jgi:hypothetical protein
VPFFKTPSEPIRTQICDFLRRFSIPAVLRISTHLAIRALAAVRSPEPANPQVALFSRDLRARRQLVAET